VARTLVTAIDTATGTVAATVPGLHLGDRHGRGFGHGHHRKSDFIGKSDDGAQGNHDSDRGPISADGRYAAFACVADDLA
jgi:hypothetical protein